VISQVVVLPLIAALAYAAGQLYALAIRRGRRGVRTSALRARTALIVAALLAVPVAVVNVWAAPLVLLPAAAAIWLTLPRLSRLIQTLYAEPWGPSDPAVRRAAADPALVVPAQIALLGALLAGFASLWTAAVMSYGLVAAIGCGLALLARRRRALLARFRVGTLRRVLVQAPVVEELPERQPVAA
jgi:hypothetical protein